MGTRAHRCCSLRVPLCGAGRPRPGGLAAPPSARFDVQAQADASLLPVGEKKTQPLGTSRSGRLAGTGVLWGPGPGEGGGGSRSAARGRQKSPRGEQDCFFPVSRAGRGRRSGTSGSGWGRECVPLFSSVPTGGGGGGHT